MRRRLFLASGAAFAAAPLAWPDRAFAQTARRLVPVEVSLDRVTRATSRCTRRSAAPPSSAAA
jgi:hypothetical protein